jgi:hypothetical protein
MIRRLDAAIRDSIKKVYHLPQCTANGLVYCSKRDGGLGIPKLETVVISSSLKAGVKFLENPDPVMEAVADESGMKKRLAQLARGARIAWPIKNATAIDSFKAKAKEEELSRWASLPAQGKSVRALTDDRIGNSWLFNPSLLQTSRFITAL